MLSKFLLLLIIVHSIGAGQQREKDNFKRRLRDALKESQKQDVEGTERSELIEAIRTISRSNAKLVLRVIQHLEKNWAALESIMENHVGVGYNNDPPREILPSAAATNELLLREGRFKNTPTMETKNGAENKSSQAKAAKKKQGKKDNPKSKKSI